MSTSLLPRRLPGANVFLLTASRNRCWKRLGLQSEYISAILSPLPRKGLEADCVLIALPWALSRSSSAPSVRRSSGSESGTSAGLDRRLIQDLSDATRDYSYTRKFQSTPVSISARMRKCSVEEKVYLHGILTLRVPLHYFIKFLASK
jgi:hypothetical protein